MASLLKGRQTLRSFIDTWVGPGHASGDGWRVTTQFVFYPGEKAVADQVINIWGKSNVTVGQVDPASCSDAQYTDQTNCEAASETWSPSNTIADQVSEVSFNIPENASKVEAHLITTGHSFGNTSNCAEFCAMQHDLMINQEIFSTNPWRDDCDENPVSDQFGTWEYDRNGWCPGGVAVGDIIDITNAVQPGDNTVNFDILMSTGYPYSNISPGDYLPYTIYSLKLYVYQ
jgi:hypothetical protein